jgi:hypothetical protein
MLTTAQRIVLIIALAFGFLILVLDDITERADKLAPYIQAHKEATHAR